MMNKHAIGIFDSGIGGLSVAKAINTLLPNETLIYVADTHYAPYGDKTDTFIYQRMRIITEKLMAFGAKALVVACNTATTAAIDALRKEYSLPIIGVEPGVKPAVQVSESKIVGVLATPRTLLTPAFATLAQRFAAQASILLQPCPLLVPMLENMQDDEQSLAPVLKHYLAPLVEQGADTLVLGCTHYNFLAEQIATIASILAGKEVNIIRTEVAVAKQLQRRLQHAEILNTAVLAKANIRLYTSGDIALFQRQVQNFWQTEATVVAL